MHNVSLILKWRLW